MSSALRWRRDPTSIIAAATGLQGEVFFDTTRNTLVCQDGITVGGFPLAKITDIVGLIALSRRIAPNFANCSAMVAQRSAAGTLSTTRTIGPCDNIGVWASGGAVSAGTITQITAAISGTTGYACRAAGVTLTGSGQISQSIRMEARDALKYKNKTVSFSVMVDHDVGSAINYKLVAKKPTVADNFASTTTIATSAAISVPSAAGTLLTFNNVAIGDVSNGLELEVQAACGAVTAKNFNVTEFYVNIEAIAGVYDAPDHDDELMRCERYLPVFKSSIANDEMGIGQCFSTVSATLQFPFKATTRIPPTGVVFLAAGFGISDANFTALVIGTALFTTANIQSASVSISVTSGLVAGNITTLLASGPGQLIIFTGAEL